MMLKGYIYRYLFRWEEALSPLLVEGYELQIFYGSLILYDGRSGVLVSKGSIIYYSAKNTFRFYDTFAAVSAEGFQEELNDGLFLYVVSKLRSLGYLRSSLSLLCSIDLPMESEED
jgi:hypothetical protein